MEISRAGRTLSTMAFNQWLAESSNNDAEGNLSRRGVLVVAEERLQDALRFEYIANGSIDLATASFASVGTTAGNVGTEGISYDPRNGVFVTVKQDDPQNTLAATLTFASGRGASSMAQLFDPALLNLDSLSDAQTLSTVDALAGTLAADNLLVLSLGSRRLVGTTRNGTHLSSFDPSDAAGDRGSHDRRDRDHLPRGRGLRFRQFAPDRAVTGPRARNLRHDARGNRLRRAASAPPQHRGAPGRIA